MKKQRQIQLLLISVLTLMTGGMLIGFAAYSEDLKITGTTSVMNNKWSVHLSDAGAVGQSSAYGPGGGPINSEKQFTVNELTNEVTLKVKLSKPQQYYEALIPIVNDGTFNANVVSATIDPLSPAQQKYMFIKASVIDKSGQSPIERTYAAEPTSSAFDITAAGKPSLQITQDPTSIPANSTDVQIPKYLLSISIFYYPPANPADLPTQDEAVAINVRVNIEQA